MSLGAMIYDQLKSAAGVAGIVSDRIYPERVPQGTALPYAVWSVVSNTGDHALGGPIDLFRARVQVTGFATTVLGAHALAAAVRGALDGKKGTLSGLDVGYIEFVAAIDAYVDVPDGDDAGTAGVVVEFEVAYHN